MPSSAEELACTPVAVDRSKFNPAAVIPYGLTVEHVAKAMEEFVDFLGFLNAQLHGRRLPRMETMMMPANFSSIVGEFIITAIPKHCRTLVRNEYHNGHPDLLPADKYDRNSKQYAEEGIEVKGSRYSAGWQGHNAEACWLMVCVFDSNRPKDLTTGAPLRPFRFLMVALGKLTKKDWKFSGRKPGSRRTITAAVTGEGRQKIITNWVYRDPAAPVSRRRKGS
jgi:hypothetical protein